MGYFESKMMKILAIAGASAYSYSDNEGGTGGTTAGTPCSGCGYASCACGNQELCLWGTCAFRRSLEAEAPAVARRGMQAAYDPEVCPGTMGCYGVISGCEGAVGNGGPVYASWRREALKESDEFVSMDDYELHVGNLEECGDGTNCFG